MAKVIFDGPGKVRGRIGNYVIKQYPTGAVLSRLPGKRKTIPSEREKEHRENFKKAGIYAKNIIHDPEKKEIYAKTLPPGKTVYQTAVSEYMHHVRHPELPLLFCDAAE